MTTLEHAVGRGILALCAESLGAESLGAMEVTKKQTIEYLQTRKQFGKAIGSFQALQHSMADVLLEIEQARSAVINAAAALQAERITRERALWPPNTASAASARWWPKNASSCTAASA